MRTQVITDESGFAALQPEWDAVLSASSLDGPFLRHGWLADWWSAFGKGELAVIICRDDASERLLAVLPAYRCRVGFAWPSRELRLLGDGRGGSTGLGAFALPEAEQAAWEAIAQTLLHELGAWDVVALRPISDGSAFAEVFAEKLAADTAVGALRTAHAISARPRVDLPRTWDEYLARSLSHDARRNARRCLANGEKLGATVEMVRDAEELPAALDEAISLHEARMRLVVDLGYSLNAARRSFIHSSCQRLLAEERLRLAFLVIDGERVACECQMRYESTRYAMWTGSLAGWAHAEVSKTLFTHMVRQAIDEGCTLLDFGLGEQRYKFAWGVTRVARFESLVAYAPSVRGRLSLGRDEGVALAERAFGSLPESVRRWLRRCARGTRALLDPQ